MYMLQDEDDSDDEEHDDEIHDHEVIFQKKYCVLSKPLIYRQIEGSGRHWIYFVTSLFFWVNGRKNRFTNIDWFSISLSRKLEV